MGQIKKVEIGEISKNFIPKEFLNKDNIDKFYPNVINKNKTYRKLQANEIEILVKNNNFSEDWNEIYVTKDFDPNLVINCEFFGVIKIGNMSQSYLDFHDLKLPVGLYNSTIVSCEFGDDVVVRDVHYISHYIVGDNCILFNIQEMTVSNHSKFGNGILKDGEKEDVRIWLEVGNENMGRKILPFDTMIASDAFIWSKFRDDELLMDRFVEITDKSYSKTRGFFGEVGKSTIIKNCGILKDVKIGEYAYLKGANKLKNLTVLSSESEPSQIGEGVEAVNGIVGYGSKIFYGCKTVRFVTGRNTQVKYGARLLNSVLGDNSTVSCCELLNNLIFPFHEQHHNTSFLIATTILGQSNIAAGATIGSNHNSRAADGEIFAGRGFWPGLCTSFKHNSKFASFILVAKGDYAYEMNILYPFSLLYLKRDSDSVNIMPGYWFIHNMYALQRNNYKFKTRDKRKNIVQNIETDYLAPDSVSEILSAMKRIEILIGRETSNDKNKTNEDYTNIGKKYILNHQDEDIQIKDNDAMKKYGGIISKPIRGYNEYKKMVIYFAIKNIIDYFNIDERFNLEKVIEKINELNKEKHFVKWWNVGGQPISDDDLTILKNDIKEKKINSWEEIHFRYKTLWDKYPMDKTRFGLYSLSIVMDKDINQLKKDEWKDLFNNANETNKSILRNSYESRAKDYSDPFRKMNYENEKELISVVGPLENDFLIDLKKNSERFDNIIVGILK
ncbi:MAG TPA: DUF4954 family protein [Spirochaetota bacterium]|nr:DUF4954 family protein [Spirochaetota bacterium]